MQTNNDLGCGSSSLHTNILSEELHENLFDQLNQEIAWTIMTHKGGQVPRLVSVQAEPSRGIGIPLYRHPAGDQPPTIGFSPTVLRCRDELSIALGQPFNHVLVQKYRSGADNISEHADKTLDIERGSAIVNLSVGATRVLILKPKPDHSDATVGIQKIPLVSNSAFVMSWNTNLLFTHHIKADKRASREKRADELIHNEQRISLTFRNIATFISPDGKIFGQGAKKQNVSADQTDQNEELIGLLKAFRAENKSALFDWDTHYGCGFDIIPT